MTLITNDSDEEQHITYELTPLREEGVYSDVRHPDELRWSDSLVADAKRRDFTMNCIYYTSVQVKAWGTPGDLTHDKRTYRAADSLLTLNDAQLIETLFAKGMFQKDVFVARAQEQQLAYAATIGVLINPYSGLEDLADGILCAVGNPEERFQEDALRILRAVRLVNTLNQMSTQSYDYDKPTWAAMKKLHPLVEGLAKERLHQEIVKVFSLNNPFGWVALIDELGLLPYLFPALHMNKHDDQPIRYHPFDTYTHTMLTLRHLQKINTNYLVKLGMLYHDVGKKDQYAAYAKAKNREEIQAVHGGDMNHTVCGPVYAERDFKALGFSGKEIDEIMFYVANHMKPGQILMARADNQIKKVRQLLSAHGYERTKNLLDITVADRQGQYNPLQSVETNAVDKLYVILDTLYAEEGQFTMAQLAIDGNDLQEAFSIPPGPEIKTLLTEALDRVLMDIASRNTKEEIVAHLSAFRQ